MKQQRGIALFIVIIVLVLLTSLAAAVITETRLGQSAIGLTQEKLVNEQELLGGFTEVMSNPNLINDIMQVTATASSGLTTKFTTVTVSLLQRGESYCKRSANASSVNLINCRFVQMNFNQQNNSHRVQGLAMTAGVEQPFLAAQNK